MRIYRSALAVLVCLGLAVAAGSVLAADDGAGGGPAGPPVVSPPAPPRPAAGEPAGKADDAAANGASEDDLAKLLREMSPEDVQKLIRSAIESRLKVERQQAAEEMKEDLLTDPADLKAALSILQDGPKNTQKDNIDRILRAFAKVDPRIGKAMKLMDEKKPTEAVATIEKDLNAQEATYRNAARYMLQARALAAAGKKYDAADAYQKILVDMGDRISFAASAAMESAAIYEELSRFTYAAQMYAFALNNFGVTLDEEALKLIDKKAAEYGAFGKDPLGWAGGVMSEVRKRLDKNDSGKETQEKEQKIVAVITDLIKTAEEQQQQSQSQSQSQARQKGKKPGEGEGEGQGQGQAQGKGKGPPKGNQNPSSPAQTSAWCPGPSPARPSGTRSTAARRAATGPRCRPARSRSSKSFRKRSCPNGIVISSASTAPRFPKPEAMSRKSVPGGRQPRKRGQEPFPWQASPWYQPLAGKRLLTPFPGLVARGLPARDVIGTKVVMFRRLLSVCVLLATAAAASAGDSCRDFRCARAGRRTGERLGRAGRPEGRRRQDADRAGRRGDGYLLGPRAGPDGQARPARPDHRAGRPAGAEGPGLRGQGPPGRQCPAGAGGAFAGAGVGGLPAGVRANARRSGGPVPRTEAARHLR